MFKRKANRFCTFIPGYGHVPVASELDDKPSFVCGRPERIGDDCILYVEGQYRKARLLKNQGGFPYLVDMGQAKTIPIPRPVQYTRRTGD